MSAFVLCTKAITVSFSATGTLNSSRVAFRCPKNADQSSSLIRIPLCDVFMSRPTYSNGIIKEIKVQIGDLVQEGQILVELDKENLQARLHEARAALLGAQANVKAAQAEFEKNTIEAEGVDVAFARRNRDRAEELAKDGLLPQSNLDDSRMAVEIAENRQRAAKAQLSVTQARVSQAEAAVAQAEASVERAEEELSNATIRSPIKGMVLSRDLEIGSPISSILNLGAGATLVMV